MIVSIPYRYSTNERYDKLNEAITELFQSLIGILQTHYNTDYITISVYLSNLKYSDFQIPNLLYKSIIGDYKDFDLPVDLPGFETYQRSTAF